MGTASLLQSRQTALLADSILYSFCSCKGSSSLSKSSQTPRKDKVNSLFLQCLWSRFFSSIVSNFFLNCKSCGMQKNKNTFKVSFTFFKVFTLQYRTSCSYVSVGETMQDVFNLQQNLFMLRRTFSIFLRTLHTAMATINSGLPVLCCTFTF